MFDIHRRRFLEGVAATSALTLAPSLAASGPARAAKLTDIDHIIVLMKENRSFDHYFGTLSGVRGFDDPGATKSEGESVFGQMDPRGRDGSVFPFHLDTLKTNAQRLHDLSHSWTAQHASWNGGAMNNWISARHAADGRTALTMGYLSRTDLPFYYALADAFTICDGYHCSVFGPTDPNRFYLMTGTIDSAGEHGGPAINNGGRNYTWETYPERLEAAGISWRIYHDLDDYGCNSCSYFAQYRDLPHRSELYENAMRNRPLYELLWDIRTGNIPQVTWIVPSSTVSEHPDYLPAAGEDHTNRVLQALWSNPPLWAKTALILSYDENDGLFDHVSPPVPEPGTKDEFVNDLPIGLGFRVPCLVISPFSRGGYVCSKTFDHTSVLRLIEARFGVEVSNLSKWRRGISGDLTAAFGFGEPPRLDLPKLPETELALSVAEENAMRLPRPDVPDEPTMPHQESGTRLRRG